MEDSIKSWQIFYQSGSVKDYLNYKFEQSKEADSFEHNNHRNCNTGKELS